MLCHTTKPRQVSPRLFRRTYYLRLTTARPPSNSILALQELRVATIESRQERLRCGRDGRPTSVNGRSPWAAGRRGVKRKTWRVGAGGACTTSAARMDATSASDNGLVLATLSIKRASRGTCTILTPRISCPTATSARVKH